MYGKQNISVQRVTLKKRSLIKLSNVHELLQNNFINHNANLCYNSTSVSLYKFFRNETQSPEYADVELRVVSITYHREL